MGDYIYGGFRGSGFPKIKGTILGVPIIRVKLGILPQ